MSNVKIYIKHKIVDASTGDTRTETKATIVTRESIPSFQRVFGQQVSKIVPLDENDNELPGRSANGGTGAGDNKTAPIGSAKDRALEALRKKGKELGIKGWANMGEEKLLAKVQEISAKKK